MRIALLLIFFGLTSAAFAQEQENQFLDRLLRPNMSASNPFGTKKFNAAHNAASGKEATTKLFYAREPVRQKEFSGTGNFFARLFHAADYPQQRGADLSTRSVHREYASTFATQSSRMARRAPEEKNAYATSTFVGQQSFVPHGKSQKALDQKRKQMTIDEVRELLNRNE